MATNDAAVETVAPREGAWGDPHVPVGNAPAAPRWPLVVAGLGWLAWLAFMIGVVVTRTCSLPV
jgi:hypothetical protein